MSELGLDNRTFVIWINICAKYAKKKGPEIKLTNNLLPIQNAQFSPLNS